MGEEPELMNTANQSALDLTLVSNVVAGSSDWVLWEELTIGSDQYPILCMLDRTTELVAGKGAGTFDVNRI